MFFFYFLGFFLLYEIEIAPINENIIGSGQQLSPAVKSRTNNYSCLTSSGIVHLCSGTCSISPCFFGGGNDDKGHLMNLQSLKFCDCREIAVWAVRST